MTEQSAEQRFLQRLVGEWTVETATVTGPGQATETQIATEHVRAFGGGWIVAEGASRTPGADTASLMSLCHDAERSRIIGTFIASMMTYVWLYEGTLDESGQVLTLYTEGPSLTTDGQMGQYRDTITFESDDHRVLTSNYRADDGEWHAFMTGHYRRIA